MSDADRQIIVLTAGAAMIDNDPASPSTHKSLECWYGDEDVLADFGLSHYSFWGDFAGNIIASKLKTFPVDTWMCTDTVVGLYLLWMDNKWVGFSWQPARKSSIDHYWTSLEDATAVRQMLLDNLSIPENKWHNYVDIVDPVAVHNAHHNTKQEA